jgi:hypothetical protein
LRYPRPRPGCLWAPCRPRFSNSVQSQAISSRYCCEPHFSEGFTATIEMVYCLDTSPPAQRQVSQNLAEHFILATQKTVSSPKLDTRRVCRAAACESSPACKEISVPELRASDGNGRPPRKGCLALEFDSREVGVKGITEGVQPRRSHRQQLALSLDASIAIE